jgi:hypothetical protein
MAQEPRKPGFLDKMRAVLDQSKDDVREHNRKTDELVARFDPTRRKDHVPFSKGVANEFGAMIGRLIGRVLFVLLIIWIAYWFGLFK